jgi:hypothetical protein
MQGGAGSKTGSVDINVSITRLIPYFKIGKTQTYIQTQSI